MPGDLERARQALRARQGAGARYDAAAAPAADLLLARRGAAFFARLLNAIPDAAFAHASAIPGRSRASIVADVSFRARGMAIALKGLREGLTAEEARWAPDLALAVTLPPHALRSLYRHSDVHLNVEFRDLGDAHWHGDLTLGGSDMRVRDMARRRAGDVWIGAMALGAGATVSDLPAEFAGSGPRRMAEAFGTTPA